MGLGVYDPNDEEEQYETLNLSNFKGKIISVKLGENFEIDRSSFASNSSIRFIGFRNPWRFNYDEYNNSFYIPDVGSKGQNAYEELNLVNNPNPNIILNFGWPHKEGRFCRTGEKNCVKELEDPLFSYSHKDNIGFSIIGGVVHRNKRNINIKDSFYVFGDWVSGRIVGFKISDLGIKFHEIIPSNSGLNPVAISKGPENSILILDYKGTYII